jgi:hypothetical protein
MLWGVSIQQGNNASSGLRDLILEHATQATGGLRLTAVSTTALESMLARVADSLIAQQVVTYAGPDTETLRSIQASAEGGVKVLVSRWVR